MGNALNLFRRIFKSRKQQRFQVRNGTFVVIVTPGKHGQEEQKKVHMIDISMGGAAFIYEGSPAEFDESGFFKISASTPHTEKVYFETVSDIPAPGNNEAEESYRRRGVKFTWMGALGESYLKDFIKEKGLYPL
jgi:c-di-GMP-binding flagellar brake protein YcgR